MRVSSLITLGMATIALSVGAGGGAVLLRDAADHARAVDGANAAVLTEATLAAQTKLLDERAATNAARSESRSATDAAFNAVSQAVRSQNATWSQEIPARLDGARQHLADLRRRADALLAKPPTDRPDADLRQVASDMTAIVAELSPVLDIAEAMLARADPTAVSLATTARLATEMRDYAGRLGLTLTPLGGTPATDAGRLQALIEQLRRFFGRTGHDPQAERALDETEQRLREAFDPTRQGGGLTDASSGPGAGFSIALQSAGKLADRALAQMTQRMQTAVAERSGSLRFTALVLALILAVIGAIYWIMRTRISQPLRAVSDATQRLAGGGHDVTIPTPVRSDELGRIANALETVRAALKTKARTEASLLEQQGTISKLSAELRSEREAASRIRSGFRAMARHETAAAGTPPLDSDILELPSEMIVEDETVFDPTRASGDGTDRFERFLVAAAFLNGCIRDSIEADDRDALKAAARRLANTSLTAGALRIGMLARTLEGATLQTNTTRLLDLEQQILAAFALTAAQIRSFTATPHR